MQKPKHKPGTVIKALENAGGFKAAAARALKVSRPTLDSYLERWPEVKQAYENVNEAELDNSERTLFDLRDNSASDAVRLRAAEFHLNKKGRHRGYGDRALIDITTGGESLNDARKEAAELTTAELLQRYKAVTN